MNPSTPEPDPVARAKIILTRTPPLLRTWLAGLPSGLLEANEGPDTFSPRDVLAHLLQGEEDDWIPRARRILAHGESLAFEPFDRVAFRERHAELSLEQLLDRFEAARRTNLAALHDLDLDAAKLARRGTHPEFGPVTLSELLYTWAVHDLAHLGQIARVMAKTMKDEVGPWRAYLGVLDR